MQETVCDGHISGAYIGADHDAVISHIESVEPDDIVAGTAAEMVRVVSRAADQHVITQPAVQDVIAGAAV